MHVADYAMERFTGDQIAHYILIYKHYHIDTAMGRMLLEILLDSRIGL